MDYGLYVSEDGYIRISNSTLSRLQFDHIFSDIDDSHRDYSMQESEICVLSGYTEWISLCVPVVSIGWDWCASTDLQRGIYVRSGVPRSNIMLVDCCMNDLGLSETVKVIENLIDTFNWQEKTADTISILYNG